MAKRINLMRLLPVALTEVEMNDRRDELARVVTDIDTMEANQKEAARLLREELKPLKQRRSELSNVSESLIWRKTSRFSCAKILVR